MQNQETNLDKKEFCRFMCGIAGIIHLDGAPISPVLLKKMTDVIAHRGPDGEGHWHEGPIALGHRRLAIIDLSPAGNQPMQSRDGRYVLSYNGEVYNFRELRAELQSLGLQVPIPYGQRGGLICP